ncbi:hypothetical protein ASPZODRAFT_136694 [Penicilliopsis zonata CBS 506.65]|uniref:CCHC-type domain-containing protein n=1 Tax=Penicilliopsis zonata CBS 506.65 TaxID=1073090 RepID=A0A1L9S7J9_9EURO|nr:hypothetical protein ASPZODRAFT_136694 [Penicilliopsis zonata CBS 506.65]OJJ43141.1 hypothetical protein ASPZODRAFT_136694 [Penicilliopsis zonata CBS 506.65]
MEFIDTVSELQALPGGLHLLCPRQDDGDLCRYEDANEVNETGRNVGELIEEAKTRREKFVSCMRILAYSEEAAEKVQRWLREKIDESLERCELCIKQYYMGKIWLLEQLKESYEEEETDRFARMLDEWDIQRITRNLAVATATLRPLPRQEIGLHVLDRASLLAIFETLSCEAMLRDDELLRAHFDEPFELIQSKRSLKVSDYIPAISRFLFDPVQLRNFWAFNVWSRYARPPTTEEFDWAIKEGLLDALRVASQHQQQQQPQPQQSQQQQQPPPQLVAIQRLWRGMTLIVKRLDKDQITHNLRALEIDPVRLSVEHLAIPTPGLKYLLNTIQLLLEKAPGDFWVAMHTIAPHLILEQVFNNYQFRAFLRDTAEDEPYEKSALKDMLSWIKPFMASLTVAQRNAACRILLKHLLGIAQDERYAYLVRYHCFDVSLDTLLQLLRHFTDNESSRGSVGRITLSEALELVSENIITIINPPHLYIEKSRQEALSALCMDVIRNTLALECQSLKSDYETILKEDELHHGVSTYSAKIWDAVVLHLHEDNLPLSTAALLGILPLVGLERFARDSTKEEANFNDIYDHLTHLSCQIIERLADFKPEHLNDLFKSQDTCSALVSALFSADPNTYQAAVDLIKNMSGQSARRDAISHLLQTFFSTTMYGLTWSFRRISNMKTFASAPRMIYTGTDIVDILCNSQTGLLRTRKLINRREILSLQKLWEYLWQAVTTIFDETESWHRRGNHKNTMLEFCRDTIQFAELLFSQFEILISAVIDADPNQSQTAREVFLKFPTSALNGMVKWLRLKDEYLATTLTSVLCSILARLGELKVTTVNKGALEYIEGVAYRGTVRTIILDTDKAKLVKSLETYYGRPIVTAVTASSKKQSHITDFAKAADASSTSGVSRLPSEEFEDSEAFDDVIIGLSSAVELNKKRRAAEAKERAERAARAAPGGISRPATPVLVKPKASVLSFREKREREKEEKRKRDLAMVANMKKGLAGVAEQTAEQGSGLRGIGIRGKDHTPVQESMMVSSESENESDSEDEIEQLVRGKGRTQPDAVKEYEESKKRSLKQQGPVKKTKQIRSANDMRARLAPDLSSLHRTLLGWDFFANGDLPPHSGRTDYSLVSNTFGTVQEYQRTFEPLLILEAWQGFQASKEEGTFKPFEIKVATRLTLDSFVEVNVTMPLPDVKDLGLGEADIVLLSKSRTPATDSAAPHCLARVSSINRKKGSVELSFQVNPGNSLMSSFAPNVTIWGVKITSLTPLEREYGALMGLKFYDLCTEITEAKPSPILRYADATLKPLADNYSVNPAQAKAIKSALDNDGFTLIQGPPGSGKTKTIVALVGGLLSGSLVDQGVAIARPTTTTTTTTTVVGHHRPAGKPATNKKLLVCAPSNAAVDELVMRLKEGVKTLSGRHEKLSVLRLGRSDAINANVLDVTLDELVNSRLNQNGRKGPQERDLQKIYMEHKAADTAFKETRARLDECRAKGLPVPEELAREFDLTKKKRTQLSLEVDNARDKNHTAARDAELTRRRIQQEIIDGAHVICATLSGSGHEMFQSLNTVFETVIIDEAAQSIELGALIPLKYGCTKCILVGDPKQLPPTVLSKVASRFQYEQSLFVRMQANHPNDVHLLDTQYRMHPEISRFPSAAFYDGRLQDGPQMAQLRTRPWHQSELLSPYRFFDVQGLHQNAAKGHSLVNLAELRVAMQLYERLTTDFRGINFAGKIGIITPYKGQLRELKSRFAAKYGNSILTTVDFNTTDAFQGRESEVIIFSCVRASNKGIGFLADIRRMNVGLTRAKSSLWVLGNSQSLVQGEFWNGLITDARARNVYTDGDVLQILQRPQFTGYKNVEMAGTDLSAAEQEPSPSVSVSVSASASARNTPPTAPLPDGPSGGAHGLDETRMCGICGSAAHMTHRCDNVEAKEAARGTCHRCGTVGHSRFNCTKERCLECGQFGHSPHECQFTRPLSKREKGMISKEEYRHAQLQKQRVERQRERQLGGHDPKVPVLQVTTGDDKSHVSTTTTTTTTAPPKRKRSDSPTQEGAAAAPSRNSKHPKPGNQPPKGPRYNKLDAKPPPTAGDLVKPSRDGPAYAPLASPANQPPTGPRAPSANGPPRPGSRPGNGMQPRPPPPFRKKKETDPFIRPKRR